MLGVKVCSFGWMEEEIGQRDVLNVANCIERSI